jgi:hypothetical protein
MKKFITVTAILLGSFIQVIGQCPIIVPVDTVIGCNGTFYWSKADSTYITLGLHQDTIRNNNGCDTVRSIYIEDFHVMNLMTVDTFGPGPFDLTSSARTLGSVLPINTTFTYWSDSLLTDRVFFPNGVGPDTFWIKASNSICTQSKSINLRLCHAYNGRTGSCTLLYEAIANAQSGDTITMLDAISLGGFSIGANKNITFNALGFTVDVYGTFTIGPGAVFNWIGSECPPGSGPNCIEVPNTPEGLGDFNIIGSLVNGGLINIINGNMSIRNP